MCLPILPVIGEHTAHCLSLSRSNTFTAIRDPVPLSSVCERRRATLCSKQAVITSIYRIDLIEQKTSE